jgi:hypothetical protein
MKYFRSSVNGSVFARTGQDLNGDIWEPVIVIPVAQWRRLVGEDLVWEVARLTAELERWKAPLTEEQKSEFSYRWDMGGENLDGIDAAIRKVRRKEVA